MILSTLVTSQLHFEMCAGLYGHPVLSKIHLVPEVILSPQKFPTDCPHAQARTALFLWRNNGCRPSVAFQA